jgi:hypothetical protein
MARSGFTFFYDLKPYAEILTAEPGAQHPTNFRPLLGFFTFSSDHLLPSILLKIKFSEV